MSNIYITKKGVILPFKSDESGNWEFMTSFDEDYHYIKFHCDRDVDIIAPLILRERNYTYKLFTPSGKLFAYEKDSKAITLQNKEI